MKLSTIDLTNCIYYHDANIRLSTELGLSFVPVLTPSWLNRCGYRFWSRAMDIPFELPVPNTSCLRRGKVCVISCSTSDVSCFILLMSPSSSVAVFVTRGLYPGSLCAMSSRVRFRFVCQSSRTRWTDGLLERLRRFLNLLLIFLASSF